MVKILISLTAGYDKKYFSLKVTKYFWNKMKS